MRRPPARALPVPGLDLARPARPPRACRGPLRRTVELAAFRLSRVYPLAVQVRMDRAVAQQVWQRQARGLLGAVVLLFLIALGIAVAVFRHVRRLEREWQDAEMRAATARGGVVFRVQRRGDPWSPIWQNRVLRVNPAHTG